MVPAGRVQDDLGDLLDDGPWYLSDGVTCRPTGPLTKADGLLRGSVW
jgi:hypothetical protein